MKNGKLLTIVLIFLVSCSQPVKRDAQQKALGGVSAKFELPRIDKDLRVLEHTAYTIGYSDSNFTAEWVAYELTSEMLNKEPRVERSDRFIPDPLLPSQFSVKDSIYKNSGYDRGHLLPAADMGHSSETIDETFYLSNISPQKPSFNRGIWKKLEEQVRKWAIARGKVYIVTGPVLSSSASKLGNKIPIPGQFYKAIFFYSDKKVSAIGFIMQNDGSRDPLASFAVTIDKIEEDTGLDLFYQLPDNIESEVEGRLILSDWPL